MTKTKKVYSSKIAGALCRQGFKVVKTEINPRKPWLDVFLFEETEELLKAFDNILTKQST